MIIEKETIDLHTDISNAIRHYGILGMKWGVRRSEKELARSRGEDISSLSDDELRSRVSRMQLERQYRDLSNSNSTSSGKKWLDKAVNQLGGAVITGLVGLFVSEPFKMVRKRFRAKV